MLKDKDYRQRGFTLIELMLVVAIIGTLSALVIPRVSGSQEAARTARVQADLRTIESAIVMFEADVGALPTAINQLTAAYTPVAGGRSFGPYLRTIPVAPDGTVRVNATKTDVAKNLDAAASYSINTDGRAIFVGANGDYTVENIR